MINNLLIILIIIKYEKRIIYQIKNLKLILFYLKKFNAMYFNRFI